MTHDSTENTAFYNTHSFLSSMFHSSKGILFHSPRSGLSETVLVLVCIIFSVKISQEDGFKKNTHGAKENDSRPCCRAYPIP